jgi:hypothetical protein
VLRWSNPLNLLVKTNDPMVHFNGRHPISILLVAGYGKALWARRSFIAQHIWDNKSTPRRMLKKAAQQGCSKRRGEARTLRYVEPLNEARTPLEDFFSILLDKEYTRGIYMRSL